MVIRLINVMLGGDSTPTLQRRRHHGPVVGATDPYWGSGKINARAECGGIQRTRFYVKIRCVSDHGKLNAFHMPYVTRHTIPA